MTFNEKIIDIQDRLDAPKNQYNDFGGFSFRSCEDILSAVKPLLKEHGLKQHISDKITAVKVGEDKYRVYVEATVTVTDGENTETVTAYAREPKAKKGMDEAQVTGSTSSYARKYALNGLWLIDDVKDPDTNENTRRSSSTRKTKSSKKSSKKSTQTSKKKSSTTGTSKKKKSTKKSTETSGSTKKSSKKKSSGSAKKSTGSSKKKSNSPKEQSSKKSSKKKSSGSSKKSSTKKATKKTSTKKSSKSSKKKSSGTKKKSTGSKKKSTTSKTKKGGSKKAKETPPWKDEDYDGDVVEQLEACETSAEVSETLIKLRKQADNQADFMKKYMKVANDIIESLEE